MILQSIQPINWGPFPTDQLLEVEQDVTVVTGANDTGKSSLLRLIEAVLSYPDHKATENDVNIDHRVSRGSSDPSKEPSLAAYATFAHSSTVINGAGQHIQAGTPLRYYMTLAKSAQTVQTTFLNGSRYDPFNFGDPQPKLPRVISFPVEAEVRDVIALAKPNHVESKLLQIAFGQNFDAAKVSGYNKVLFAQQLNQARRRLEDATRRLLPASMNLTLDIQTMPGAQSEVMIQPVERDYGFAPLMVRGRGVRTMVTLLSLLLDVQARDQQIMILLDEPETSLHADAQHMLRSLLEEVAKKPTVQVIYATHSSSMINNMRPQSVRLLTRSVVEDRVVTRILKRPTDLNFLAVRTSLGITPSDSLLYAPVMIIVEGPTDALGVAMLLPKMQAMGLPGFNKVASLLARCHIVDGEGDSYAKLLPLAVSQGSKPAVFLDGDKKVPEKLRAAYPDVPFVLLDGGSEIEELIERGLYFQALNTVLRQDERFESEDVSPEAFEAWVATQDDTIKKRAFTKRIEAWLQVETRSPIWDKPAVFRVAVGLLSAPEQIRTNELAILVQHIERLLLSQ